MWRGAIRIRQLCCPESPVSRIIDRIRSLVAAGEVRVSAHGYDEAAADGLRVRELIQGVTTAVVVEDYPHYPKGPCVLVRYRPDPELWTRDYLRRGE